MKKTFLFIFLLIGLGGCISTPTTTNDSTTDSKTDTKETATSSTSDETITFGDTITTDGSTKIADNTATISKGGTYTITGSSDDGELIINAPEENVTLILSDLTLTSATTSAITGIDAASLTITLEGENTLSDTENNTDDYQAPLYIDEIETHINGSGTLNLNGNYQEGLESNNDLYIDEGTFNITAQDDGINAGDLLSINGGTINIDSNGDGIDSNGNLEITGGTTYVSSGNNGNGPIDYGDEGNTFTLTGGTIIGTGGNMGVTPTEEGQTFLHATGSGTNVNAGDLSYESPKEFSYVFISSPTLTEDTQITIDGTEVSASTEAETGMGGGRGGHMMDENSDFDPSTMQRPDGEMPTGEIPTDETPTSSDTTSDATA